jgi:4-amino-4-deoxy-L-arabinose transferase-like glycosyltransferase
LLESGPRREGRLLAAIVLFALVVRVLLLVALETHAVDDPSDPEVRWTFAYEAGRIAESLERGDGFASPFREPSGPTAWLTPVYPWLVALAFGLFGAFTSGAALVLLLLNCVASALTCVPIYLIGKRAFGVAPALLAAVGWAVYPPSILHAVQTIWDTSLFTLLGALLIWALYALEKNATRFRLAVYGLGLGLAALVKTVALAFLPFVLWWAWRRPRRSTAWRLQAAALLAGGALLALTPWLARNATRFDRPFLRSNLGLELSLGNSERAWQDWLDTGLTTEPWYLGHPSMMPEELERFRELGEVGYVDRRFAESKSFMLQNPGKVARLTVRRVAYYWLLDPHSRKRLAQGVSPVETVWRLGRYLAPLPFMILGIALALGGRRPVGPVLGYLVLVPIIYYLTHVSGRYRIPVEPCVVLFASHGAWWLLVKLAGVIRRESA